MTALQLIGAIALVLGLLGLAIWLIVRRAHRNEREESRDSFADDGRPEWLRNGEEGRKPWGDDR